MKKFILAFLVLVCISACEPDYPHHSRMCVQSHTESTVIPMAMPDGSGGVTIQMMYSTEDVCDSAITVCRAKGKQVDENVCESWMTLHEKA